MKKIFLFFVTYLSINLVSGQDFSNLSNALEEGYSATEIEKIFSEVTYKGHEKWMKKQGYTYDRSKSTDKYFFYKKNSVVDMALYHRNNEIIQVLFISSPQKYYMAVAEIRKDKSYRLVLEEIKDNGGGKFVASAQWVKNGNVLKASTDGHILTIYKDFEGMTSKPTITSYDDASAVSKAVVDIQAKLDAIGAVYPKVGSFYDGNQKITQRIDAASDQGKVKIEKARWSTDNCKTSSSFNTRELVTLELKDVIYVSIYEYPSKDSRPSTFALCIGIRDWEKIGDRKYQTTQTGSYKHCTFSDNWNVSTEAVAYITPYVNCAIAFEFTNRKNADDVKALIDKAVSLARK